MTSCRYHPNEFVGDAVGRMEQAEAREPLLVQSAAELLLADLAGKQPASIRWLVRKRLESAGTADAVEYTGRDGLHQLAVGVKSRGRKRLQEMRVRPNAKRDWQPVR